MKINIAIIGLDNAGKSTTLNFLVEGEPTETIPTVGVNYEQIKMKKVDINMIDLGGQQAFRKFWKGPIQSSQCLVFVIDATDKVRFPEAADELYDALKIFPEDFPVLILANKQDLEGAASKEDIVEEFQMIEKLKGRDFHVEATSAITGSGLSEAFHWLYEHITGEKVKKNLVPKDIIIFDKNGVPIISKSEIFKESELAAGFLSAMNSFISVVAEDKLTSITMGKHKVIFQHMKELIGAIILTAQDSEKVAEGLLEKLLTEIVAAGMKSAETVMSNFILREIKSE
ncbi:MAG: ADP-ribosylation factor-like protein [Candidatus Hodarchaeota archaeon]